MYDFFADSSAIGEKEIIIRRKRPESYEKCTAPSDWRTDLHP